MLIKIEKCSILEFPFVLLASAFFYFPFLVSCKCKAILTVLFHFRPTHPPPLDFEQNVARQENNLVTPVTPVPVCTSLVRTQYNFLVIPLHFLGGDVVSLFSDIQ